MSTRLARRIPALTGDAREVPVAYLLEADELNADDSNFWIFTEAAFRRMLRRTNWHVRDYMTVGDTVASDPVSLERDERVFCFAESRYGLAHVELLEGWHEPEGSGWRWTERVFALRVLVPVGASRPSFASRFMCRRAWNRCNSQRQAEIPRAPRRASRRVASTSSQRIWAQRIGVR